MFSRLNKKILLSFLLLAGLFLVVPALAQVNTGIEFGQYTGLTSVDIRITVAKIIRAALGLLGVVALGLVLYGGYLYMTAGGNEEQVGKAKKLLLNAAIGLAIILSAFAITQFILSKLAEGTTAGGGTNQPVCTGDDCYPGPYGGGSLYTTSTPQGQLPIKNVVVSITFFNGLGWSAAVNPATIVRPNVLVNKFLPGGQIDNTPVAGDFVLLDGNTKVEFHPTGSCVDPDHPAEPAFSDPSNTCFEKNTRYRVLLTAAVYAANQITPLTCNVLHPCESYFTTGEMFDRTPPTASLVQPGNGAVAMADPGDRVSQFCPQIISADFTDDSGVKEVDFYSDKLFSFNGRPITVQAVNPYSANGSIDTNLWHPFLTDPTKAEIDNVYVEAFDLDGHSTQSAKQQVKILPATCYNGRLDLALGEEQKSTTICEPDCGAASQCGACPGGACNTSLDCAGTYCDPLLHICVARPKITNVEKKDGKEGNYVTIYGQNFGTTPGKVIFNSNKEAGVVSCFNQIAWKDGSVVVKVPVGAITGPLEIRTAGYSGAGDITHSDVTNDNWGPNFPATDVFLVNNVARPGLCGLDPDNGQPETTLGVSGSQLGTAIIQPNGAFQAQITVTSTPTVGRLKFGNYLASLTAWSGTVIATKAPNLPPQYLTVQAEVANEESNSVPFIINAVSQNLLPQIDYIDPENGPVGSYVTIFGRNFGTINHPRVYFGTIQATPPANCPDSWSDTQIVVKVPDTMTPGTQLVRINNVLGDSNNVAFEVDTSPPRPGLCSILPDNGPVNTPVALKGEGFGAAPGALEFWKFTTTTPAAAYWADGAINGKVPAAAQTGSVKVWNSGTSQYSNSLNFKVQNCQTDKTLVCGAGTKCCASGSCLASCPEEAGPKASVYSWLFSTGRLPAVPKVVEECGANKVPSPTPSQLWEPADAVCINAQLKIKFSTLIKSSTVSNTTLKVESCADANCTTPQPVNVSFGFSLTNGTLANGYASGQPPIYDTVTASSTASGGLWTPNTRYRVTLPPGGITSFVFDSLSNEVSALEASLPVPYTFKFKTRDNSTYCVLGSAVVSPDPFISREFNAIYYPETDKALYSVTALADENVCWALDANLYDWKWNVADGSGNYVNPDTDSDPSVYAKVTNDKQTIGTPTYDPVLLTTYPTAGRAYALAVSSTFAYVISDTAKTLEIVDVTKRPMERVGGVINLVRPPYSILVYGSYIFIGTNGTLEVYKINETNPVTLLLLRSVSIGGSISGMARVGDYLYLSNNGSNALDIVNITAPATPVKIATILNGRRFNDIKAAGNYLYLTNFDSNKLTVVNVDSPATPVLKNEINTGATGPNHLTINGHYVYVVETGGKLEVYDIGPDAALPALVSSIGGIFMNGPVAVSDGFAYVGSAMLDIFDVSRPAAPSFIKRLAGNGTFGVAAAGNYVYTAMSPNGLGAVQLYQSEQKGKPEQDLITKVQETPPGGVKVFTQTTSGGKTVADDALLYIKLTNPKVLEKWPDCNAACVNAGIGATFNVELSASPTYLNASNVKLCKISNPDQDCADNLIVTNDLALEKTVIGNDTLVIDHGNLTPDSYYRVILIGNPATGLKSGNEIEMDKDALNYHCDATGKNCQDYSWTFRTKTDQNICSISRVEVQPASSTVQWVGAQAPYFSVPWGTKDACSPFGQRLTAWSYGWSWMSLSPNIATVSSFDKTAASTSICNSSCLHQGLLPGQVNSTLGLCGDGQVSAAEDCDSPGVGNCGLNCLLTSGRPNVGTLKCADVSGKDCCGNSIKEANEDCDLGALNGVPGSGCSISCLKTGTKMKYSVCKALGQTTAYCRQNAVSVCGDGYVDTENGEECDAGTNNGRGYGCTDTCLKTAIKMCDKNTTVNCCGNGVSESGNAEECDGERWCTKNCQNAGASVEYGSFCGDGITGQGEDTGCDVTGAGDGKIDPWQLATAVGGGVLNNQKQQVADIQASAEGKNGTAKFILQCGFEPLNGPCPATDIDKGVGTDSCCYPRPTVTATQPSVNVDVCPNTAIKLQFTELMDEATFKDERTGGLPNILLAEETATAACPPGSYQVTVDTPPAGSGLWAKILSFGRHLLGLPARAQIFCQGAVDYKLSFATIDAGGKEVTEVSLDLTKPLDFEKTYKIIVLPAVKSVKGVSPPQPVVVGGVTNFTTKKQTDGLCKIETVKMNPETWLFSTLSNITSDDTAQTAEADKDIRDIDKVFTATASYIDKTIPDSPIQEIQPTSAYNWVYTWSVGDSGSIVTGPTRDADTSHPGQSKEFKIKENPSKNGLTQVSAELKITADESASPTVGATYSVTSTVQVFICNNPWPDATMHYYGLGWADIDGVTTQGRGWNNFKLLYCRDAGKENDASDDLPELRPPTVLPHTAVSGDPIFKEFFFTFNSPAVTAPQPNTIKDDRDSIGVRVYPNTQHLTLLDWYNSQPNIVKGVPVPVKVGNYEALQEGRTFYISGLNVANSPAGQPPSSIYSNVFVFSFSSNPTAETLNIVNQLMANLTLNINVTDPDVLTKMYRDFRRVQDLQLVTKKLNEYFQKNGSYPDLKQNPEIGTFLPSQTTSRWRSWQGVLGNALGYNLPVDPQNDFNGCGTTTLSSYDPQTCWDATAAKFICPSGSHIYQYVTKGGASATLKADFELPSNMYQWVSTLYDTRPTGVVNTLDYQTAYTCDDVAHGVGGSCGDGIVGPGETCEIGQKQNQNCNVGDYTGIQTYSCNSTCSGWTVGKFICDAEDDSINGRLGKVADPSKTTTAVVTSVAGKNINITEYAACPQFTGDQGNARVAACNAYWIYNFDFPADGKYGLRVDTRNASNLNDPVLTETTVPSNPPPNACPEPGIQHHLIISIDGTKIGELCQSAVTAIQTGWVSLGNVKKGRHNIKVEWDNDWTGPGGLDSNVEIHKVAIARGCHSGTGTATCVPQGRCGDGIIQSPKETCDDGANNGKYGYCNSACSGQADITDESGYCGNYKFDKGKEVCDSSSYNEFWCKNDSTKSYPYLLSTYIDDCKSSCGSVLNCTRAGAKYSRIQADSCSWDCQSYDYCGDGRVNSQYEECEKSESCQVGTCSQDSTLYCETDDNCGAGNTCQNKQPGKRYCKVPGEVKPALAMVGYCSLTNTKSCERDSDCPTGETCPAATKRPLFRNAKDSSGQDVKYGVGAKADCGWAKFDGIANKLEAYNTTVWAKLTDAILRPEAAKADFNIGTLGSLLNINWLLVDWNTFDWSGLDLSGVGFQQNQTCLPLQLPPPTYEAGNCGNGNLDTGEVCDDGVNNGQICTDFSAAGTCTYCAYGCQQVITVQQ